MASVAVLLVLILFVGSAAYSAVETARSGSTVGAFAASFQPNGTIQLTGTLTLGNQGFYPVRDLTLSLRVANGSGALVGSIQFGPEDLAGGSGGSFPILFYLPVSASGPGPSLLTRDQSLPVVVWANATVGYLFPISLLAQSNRSWGAPFADLAWQVGTPRATGGTVSVPVTVSFQNHADFAEVGTIDVTVRSSGGAACGSGGFVLNDPPGAPYTNTTSIDLAAGCSPAGGSISAAYVTPSYTIPLPPEAIP